jgi:hypothetical protein
VIFLALSALGAHMHRFWFFAGIYGRSRAYLFSIGLEWATLAFVAFGLSKRGLGVRDLLGRNSPRVGARLYDLGIAIGFMLAHFLQDSLAGLLAARLLK